MRLIDADALIAEGYVLEKYGESNAFISRKSIADIPTAYDAEQFLKENDALKFRCRALTNGTMCFFCPSECKYRTDEYRGAMSGKE